MSTYNPGTYILTQTSRQRQFFYEILNTILKLIFPLHKVAKYKNKNYSEINIEIGNLIKKRVIYRK